MMPPLGIVEVAYGSLL
jgi:hypothetical protein